MTTIPATRVTCPLNDCMWDHVQPSMTLPDLPDLGQTLYAATATRNHMLESLLAQHAKTHPVEQWLSEVIKYRVATGRPFVFDVDPDA